jgi:hypothetical protein
MLADMLWRAKVNGIIWRRGSLSAVNSVNVAWKEFRVGNKPGIADVTQLFQWPQRVSSYVPAQPAPTASEFGFGHKHP